MNQLCFGENLHELHDHIDTESVDLICIDPPFNSKHDHNILFRNTKGHSSDAQITAFDDTLFKYVARDGADLMLIPENHRAHRETRITIDDGQETPVVGRVLWSWTNWAPPNPDDDAGQTGEKKARYKAEKK